MKRNTIRTILSVMLIVALMASFSVVAFAADKEFKFELTLKTVDDVVIKSAKNELSVKKAAPELFERYSGQQVAYFVAYDCFLKGREYTVEENGTVVTFKFDGPTTVLVPSVIDVTSNKDLDVVVLGVDIPDGTEVTVTVGSDPSKEFTGKVENGKFAFNLPKDFLKNYKNGDALPVVVEYEVDGKSYKDSVTVPAVDGAKTGTAAKDTEATPALIIPTGGDVVVPGGNGGNEQGESKALGDKNGVVFYFGPLGGIALEEKDQWILGKEGIQARYIPQQFDQIGAGAAIDEELLPGMGISADLDATVGVLDVINMLFGLIVDAAK